MITSQDIKAAAKRMGADIVGIGVDLTSSTVLPTTADGTPLVAYYTDGALLDHIWGRDFWMDTEEDMLFGRIDLVLNSGTYDRVMQQIAEITADPHRGGFVSVMIHEQYFYKDYRNYLPDYADRVLDVCEFLQEKGYTGAHICDVTTERDLREHPLFP